ncbi:hypothetical protein SDJN03_28588, partial [Cucurbita argyrosperma subsp. sororia]
MSSGAVAHTGQSNDINHDMIDAKKGFVWITWTSIHNVEEANVQEIAKFAVEEYNKKYKKQWKCKRIQQGWYSVMKDETQYRFLLEQDDVRPGDQQVYQAIVSLKVNGIKLTKNLILFMPYFKY